MPYILAEGFGAGMDRRRERVAGTPGTLWLGKNVHITRGGDIERRKKLVPEYDVEGSFGVAALRSQLYTFGSADLASAMPTGVQYQRLVGPGSPAMTRVLDAKTFAGKLYAIAEYDNGNVLHFYDGNRVTDWDTIAEESADFEALARLFAIKIDADPAVSAVSNGITVTMTARVPGTTFTCTAAAVNGGAGVNDQLATVVEIQANVSAVAEVRASADVEITGGTADPGVNKISALRINGVNLLTGVLNWTSSNASTAIRLAQAISAGFATHGYTATALDAVVTIEAAPGTGATPNGFAVDVVTSGDFTVTADGTMSGGVTEVEAVARIVGVVFGGSFEVDDTFTITINGTDYKATGLASGTGRSLYVDQHRVWSLANSLAHYCKLDDASDWVDATAGFINIASESDGNETLVAAARYQNLAAFFSESNITLFQLDEDPANFAFDRVLENTGTRAAGAVVRYGNNDVFYLDLSGIRSLRARDSSNAPFVSDIGNAIDVFVQEYIDTLTSEEIATAVAAIEPRDGRYWLNIGGRVFVLSFFPGAKISAWSFYEFDEIDGEPVQAIARARDRLFVRAGDFIYAYGGLDGTTYPDDDEAVAEVETPFLSGKTPATIKKLEGFDFAGTNTWECEVLFDPNAEDKTINIGRIEQITFADANRIHMPGQTSMVALKLTCRTAGRATISMAAVHYEGEGAG